MARSAPQKYSVHRVQDGAQDRAELTLKQARDECADLNAQARQQVGMSVEFGVAIYAGMIHGQISRYEIRSAEGLVIG